MNQKESIRKKIDKKRLIKLKRRLKNSFQKGVFCVFVAQGDKAYVLTDGNPTSAMVEFKALDTNIEEDDVMSPNSSWQPTNPNLDSTNGIGRYLAQDETNDAAIRGGAWANGWAGLFGFAFSNETQSHSNLALPLRPLSIDCFHKKKIYYCTNEFTRLPDYYFTRVE